MSRLDTHVGYWIRCASSQVSHALSRKLERKGVTLAEWIVLRELYEGARRPSALAHALGLTRGTISKLAARLVANLMITQQASGADGRAQMLALTDLGRTTVRVLAVLVDDNEEEFFGDLEPGTRALIVATLREIVRRRGSRATPAG
ncbi:MAG TPA: MarR family winged helix-turn-helix transcriptional regulator [Steroidobacteraceae bacterium]|nr:MarR family winged helix-turn-helix transcriptional regulator [Steroidobacteraceae bacterium]